MSSGVLNKYLSFCLKHISSKNFWRYHVRLFLEENGEWALEIVKHKPLASDGVPLKPKSVIREISKKRPLGTDGAFLVINNHQSKTHIFSLLHTNEEESIEWILPRHLFRICLIFPMTHSPRAFLISKF